MLLYYITDRKQFPGTGAGQRRMLLDRIAEAARAGIDYIQLREKDLTARELESLAGEALREIRALSTTTRLLINSRTDVALATGADGVHLTSDDLSASNVRVIVAQSAASYTSEKFLVGVSCHSIDNVKLAESHGADFVALAPIFEKAHSTAASIGLGAIRAATQLRKPDMRVEAGDHRIGIPVFALGGVALENARACAQAGAAGIAAIRLFQQGSILETIIRLRELTRSPGN